MFIRAAEPDDVDEIYAVEESCFSIPWSKESIFRDITDTKLTTYYVVSDDQKIVGYGGLWNVADEAQITNIAIHMQYRDRGYGEALVRALVESSWERNLAEVFLEVRTSNFVAQNLYRKLGFTVKGLRKSYYQDPVEDAYIMSCIREDYRKN